MSSATFLFWQILDLTVELDYALDEEFWAMRRVRRLNHELEELEEEYLEALLREWEEYNANRNL